MSTMVFILLLFSILLGIPEASVLENGGDSQVEPHFHLGSSQHLIYPKPAPDDDDDAYEYAELLVEIFKRMSTHWERQEYPYLEYFSKKFFWGSCGRNGYNSVYRMHQFFWDTYDRGEWDDVILGKAMWLTHKGQKEMHAIQGTALFQRNKVTKHGLDFLYHGKGENGTDGFQAAFMVRKYC